MTAVLVVKISSMGDVLHTLPAVTDAHRARSDLIFDWVVEDAFQEIPRWHPAIDRVITVATRAWRRHPLQLLAGANRTRRILRERNYHRIIDAQGLLKSAIVTSAARGIRCGPGPGSAREPFSTLAYRHRVAVKPDQHAVDRTRQLFAACLGYAVPSDPPDYGIARARLPAMTGTGSSYLVFLTGTTWSSKLWPEAYWRELITSARDAGHRVLLPWGNEQEQIRVTSMQSSGAEILPRLGLTELAGVIDHAAGAVAVDSGPGHLAAALGTPCVSIYGATDPERTGTRGAHQAHLAAAFDCSPCLDRRCRYTGTGVVTPACYGSVPPGRVWATLQTLMDTTPRPA